MIFIIISDFLIPMINEIVPSLCFQRVCGLRPEPPVGQGKNGTCGTCGTCVMGQKKDNFISISSNSQPGLICDLTYLY